MRCAGRIQGEKLAGRVRSALGLALHFACQPRRLHAARVLKHLWLRHARRKAELVDFHHRSW